MTTTAPTRLLPTLLAVLATACGGPLTGPATAPPQALSSGGASGGQAGLLAADDALAAQVALAGWAGLRRSLSEHAVYLPPGTDILRGERAIGAFLRSTPAVPTTLHREAGGASEDGQVGYTFGWSEADGAGGPTFGKYLAAWRREDGGWRVAALLQRPATLAPTAAPADSPLLAGYHGVPLARPRGSQRASVMAADRAFAAQALAQAPSLGYGPAFVDWADPAAVVFGNRNFYWGLDWVSAIYLTTIGGEVLTWAPSAGDAAGSADLGWTVGDATYHYQDPTVTIDDWSKYLTVFVRQEDGNWRWLLDDGNARPAP